MTSYSGRSRLCGILVLLVVFGSWLLPVSSSSAEESPILYLFWGDGCPHCKKEKEFLNELHSRYPALEMRWFEIWKQHEFLKLAEELRKHYNIKTASVPMTFLGEWAIVGYLSDATTGIDLEEQVVKCLKNGCQDALEAFSELPIVQRIREEAADNNPVNWQQFPSETQVKEKD